MPKLTQKHESPRVLPTEICGDTPRLHRIREARLDEEISLRAVARRSGIALTVLEQQEIPSVDLRLSELYRWQDALEIPAGELLAAPAEALSEPLRQRAVIVRIAKTAASIGEVAQDELVRSLAYKLMLYLQELMPGIDSVSAWPKFGQRDTANRWGRTALLQVSGDLLERETSSTLPQDARTTYDE